MLTPTEQNVKVWARRFGVEILNLELAAKKAETHFGAYTSRGIYFVVAMKKICKTYELEMGSSLAMKAAIIVSSILYGLMNEEVFEPVATVRRELGLVLSNPEVTDFESIWLATRTEELISMALDAYNVRAKEKSNPNPIGMILNIARGKG